MSFTEGFGPRTLFFSSCSRTMLLTTLPGIAYAVRQLAHISLRAKHPNKYNDHFNFKVQTARKLMNGCIINTTFNLTEIFSNNIAPTKFTEKCRLYIIPKLCTKSHGNN